MIHLQHHSIFDAGNSFHLAETVICESKKTYLHDHDFFEIFFVTKGCITHHADNEETTLNTKSACLVYPHTQHCFSKTSCSEAVFTNLAITPSQFFTTFKYLTDATPHPKEKAKTIHHLPEHIWAWLCAKTAQQQSTSPTKKHGRLQLKSILAELLTCFLINTSSKTLPAAPFWLQNAVSLMREKENYTQGMERFVKLSGKTHEHLSRELKKHYHTTPSHFINQLRISQAARLLQSSDKPVLDIIYEMGFMNVSFFNRLFKERFGIPPRQYRKSGYKTIVPR